MWSSEREDIEMVQIIRFHFNAYVTTKFAPSLHNHRERPRGTLWNEFHSFFFALAQISEKVQRVVHNFVVIVIAAVR